MNQTQEGNLSFEDALAQLESLVDRIETGDIPLAELVQQFQKGNELLLSCSARLKDAEQKIQLLQKERKGVSFQEFDPDKV